MKRVIVIAVLLTTSILFSQNVQVDSQTYSAQQLVEDILINSNCITNVVVTNVIGGDFNNTDQSYGYFDASGTTFPFQRGLVLSTGRLSNVEGPNTTLSDDDATNWVGDTDLETVLNESNTHNATIIEFEFTSVANQISFNYIFASEEFQENDSNTCNYSDLFGFLIRPVNDQQYTNIALVPNTQTPVKVTTVHPEIPNGCSAQNEIYFESWNDSSAPINFNGQTKVLTAIANTIPNETYHVKLVIADEQNYRFDSAVFLEAGSFKLSTDLGADKLLATQNPLCFNETLELDAFTSGTTNIYKWFKNGGELSGETNSTYTVQDEGVYNVEVTLQNNCISYGEIIVEYSQNPVVYNSILTACDFDQDGFTVYNLYDVEQNITDNDSSLIITNFIDSNGDVISNPTSYTNTALPETVYARVENQYGCFSIAEITLDISTNLVSIPSFDSCDGLPIDGFIEFNLADLKTHIQNTTTIPANATISFYKTLLDVENNTEINNNNYINSTINSDILYLKIMDDNQCYGITTIVLNVLNTPLLLPDEDTTYCLNIYPQTITLVNGALNNVSNDYTYEWLKDGNDMFNSNSTIEVNESGIYSVKVSDPNTLCSSTRKITVNPSNSATIESVLIEELVPNNSITIITSGEGNYQYALDNYYGNYQESNTFTNVLPGFHTIYVKDVNGCETIEKEVAVFGIQKFFTPNNDGYNDKWKPLGVNEEFNTNIKIYIYNRFGKLLLNLDSLSEGWDGTFNGNLLPSSDYWYKIILEDGGILNGHFSLIR